MGLLTPLLLLSLLYPSAGRDEKLFRLRPAFPTPYSLTLFVDARHLDYQSGEAFLLSLAKHPSNWTKNGDVGHAWICLKGEGQRICCGHTGETVGITYAEGVLKGLIKENPLSLLWMQRRDGACEREGGGHFPTFGATFPLTKEQFEVARGYVKGYDFKSYQLTGRQCTTFVAEVAAISGIDLEVFVEISFPEEISYAGRLYPLWRDPSFSKVRMATPDRLELALQEKVLSGEAYYALEAYPKVSLKNATEEALETLSRAPARWQRVWKMMGY